MFCPKCRSEFKQGIDRCPDCGVMLVAALEPLEQYETGNFLTVYQTSNPGMMSIAKSLLENAGIYFATKGEAFEEIFKSGTVELQVLLEDAEPATELLKDLEEMPDFQQTD
ncbi:MAG: DUF2007 domain-containing protein [Candidatus Cloacimonetes bacterium]|nr:DUF2007 domain-containing protein [Candidatus Cloacimonadota bacterium]